MAQIFLGIAAVLGGLSVAAGAFASHALRDKISERRRLRLVVRHRWKYLKLALAIKCTTLSP